MLSGDVVALVSATWQDSFKDRTLNKGKAAINGSLEDVLNAIDHSKHMYFGMVANAAMQRESTAPLEYVTGTVDLSDGLSVTFSGEFADVDAATMEAHRYETQLRSIEDILVEHLHVPSSVVDSVAIEAKGAAVVFSASAAGDDVGRVSKAIVNFTMAF